MTDKRESFCWTWFCVVVIFINNSHFTRFSLRFFVSLWSEIAKFCFYFHSKRDRELFLLLATWNFWFFVHLEAVKLRFSPWRPLSKEDATVPRTNIQYFGCFRYGYLLVFWRDNCIMAIICWFSHIFIYFRAFVINFSGRQSRSDDNLFHLTRKLCPI